MASLDYKEDARDLHAFKELRFFLSHHVPLEIRCSVSRLELPLISDYLIGGTHLSTSVNGVQRLQQQQQKLHGSMQTVDGEKGVWGCDSMAEDMNITVKRIMAEPELVATCQVFADGQPLHTVPMSSHTPSKYDPRQHAIIWDDTMCFPLRYRDLDRNSQLVVVLRGVKDRIVGVASMRFFDANGSLKMGLQKRPFQFTDKLPFSWDPSAPPSGKQPGEDGVWCGCGVGSDANDELWWGDQYSGDGIPEEDWGFRLERRRETYRLSILDRADWLDPISLDRVDRLIAALADPEELRKHRAYQTDAEAGLRTSPNLILEMPSFAHPIIHEERPYPGVPGGGGGAPVGASGVGGSPAERATSGVATAGGGGGEGDGLWGGMGEGGRAWGASDLLARGGSDAFLLVSDYEIEEDNPVEQKYRKLAHDQLRGLVDPELKPNRDERHRIDELVAARQDHLKMEDKDLLWKFRYSLTDNKRALTKLLLSVDWGVDSEVAQVEGLLAEWARRAPIDAPDALKLLGRERTFQAEVVRRFAVDALRRASDDELLAFLLQLVQALRYQAGGGDGPGPSAGAESVAAVATGAGGSSGARRGRAGKASGDGAREGGGGVATATGGGAGDGGVSPLAQFLIERASKSLELANFFYWYLRVDLEDATHGHVYRGVQVAFRRAMRGSPESARVWDMLVAQEQYVEAVSMAHKEACEMNGRKYVKDERLRELLKMPHLRRVPRRARAKGSTNSGGEGLMIGSFIGGGGGSVPMPLDPTFQITGLEPSSAFMFKSALYPCVIEFTVTRDDTSSRAGQDAAIPSASANASGVLGSGGGSETQTTRDVQTTATGTGGPTEGEDQGETVEAESGDGSSAAKEGTSLSWLGGVIKPKESSYKVIFKSGDDLRQDQLIMQMISLMDSLLKRVNLDLRLKPYGILATAPRHGLVQFVSGSQPVSSVLSEYNGSILEYLRRHNPDPSAPNGVRASAVQTFVKSTAGYCVITYLLGIGDRHLDNIMMLPTGNLFHIDFGYVFGRDPKPMAPPIRFTREMAEAMGGVNSEDYRLFKTYCCQAYNWLRKNANLIINLLSLMSDAGIADLSANPVAVLAKVEERFRLDLTDEMAEHFFLSLIGQSLQAFAPRVMDVMHQLSLARR